jgi:hypothetical protein
VFRKNKSSLDTIVGENESMADSQESKKTQAKVDFSLSFLEKHGIVEKGDFDKKTNSYEYVLTERAADRLAGLVADSKGNKSRGCLKMVLDTMASVRNPLTLEALNFYMNVVHLVAFGEKSSKKDFEVLPSSDDECDGYCEICPEEYCPAKEVMEQEQAHSVIG